MFVVGRSSEMGGKKCTGKERTQFSYMKMCKKYRGDIWI